MNLLKNTIRLLFLSFLIVACNSNDQKKQQQQTGQDEEKQGETSSSNKGQAYIDDEGGNPNALQLAIKSDDHSTLVKAVKAAGVENSLVNVGPLSVFAPTNAAFDKLNGKTLENLLQPENKKNLAKVLTNHVAPSNYPIETLKKNIEKDRKLFMASGNYVEVTEKNGDLYVGGSKIIASVDVSNGWVHVVDKVILP